MYKDKDFITLGDYRSLSREIFARNNQANAVDAYSRRMNEIYEKGISVGKRVKFYKDKGVVSSITHDGHITIQGRRGLYNPCNITCSE